MFTQNLVNRLGAAFQVVEMNSDRQGCGRRGIISLTGGPVRYYISVGLKSTYQVVELSHGSLCSVDLFPEMCNLLRCGESVVIKLLSNVRPQVMNMGFRFEARSGPEKAG